MNSKVIILLGVAAVVFILFSTKKKPPNMEDGNIKSPPPNDNNGVTLGDMSLTDQIKFALKKIIDEYGPDVARDVERVYRLETTQFTSLQFLKTFSPGMEDGHWTSMRSLWADAGFVPEIISMIDSSGGINVSGMKKFIKFNNVLLPMQSLAHYIKQYGALRWVGTNPEAQNEYARRLSHFVPKIVNSLVA